MDLTFKKKEMTNYKIDKIPAKFWQFELDEIHLDAAAEETGNFLH